MSARLVLLAAALAAASVVCHTVLRLGGGENRDLSHFLQVTRRREALDRYVEAVRRSDARKQKARVDLLAGRISLREAAAEFRWAHQFRKAVPDAPPKTQGLPEGDEVLAQHIIGDVAVMLQHDPRRAAVLARLEREYQQLGRRPTKRKQD